MLTFANCLQFQRFRKHGDTKMGPQLRSMDSHWTQQVNADAPWPEYPRPQMQRSHWLNLNGTWEFAGYAEGCSKQLQVIYITHHTELWLSRVTSDCQLACRSGNYSPRPDEPFPESIVVPFPVESKLSGDTP